MNEASVTLTLIRMIETIAIGGTLGVVVLLVASLIFSRKP